LPEPSPDAISLNTLWSKDYLRVSLSKSPDTPLGTSLTLVAHLRGIVLYAQPWDDKQNYVDFEKDFFPAGIVHFLLVDEGRNILSERLVFSLQKRMKKTWDTLCRNGLNDFRQSEDSRQCFLFWAEVLEFSVQAGLIFRIQFQ
jgi:hypothetical protein